MNSPDSNTSAPRTLAVKLALFALVTLGAVSLTQALSEGRIEANRQAHQDALLQSLAPQGTARLVPAPAGDQGWQALDESGTLLATLQPSSALGYAGPVEVLVALTPQRRVTAVRVVDHRETPGLGDAIERRKGPWIDQFEGLARHQLDLAPQGAIEALTGATITSHAVIQAVNEAMMTAGPPRDTPDASNQEPSP